MAMNHSFPSPNSADVGPISVLLISPNPDLRRNLASKLSSKRWDVHEVASGASALEKIHAGISTLVLLDPALPDLKVDEFRHFLASDYPGVEIIPINSHTGHPITAAPPDTLSFELVREIERIGQFQVDDESSALATQSPGKAEQGLPGMVGSAPAMLRLYALVRLVARRDTAVLITGESGTGKDLVARAVHDLSSRRQKPFVVINCSAIPESLLEAELFGFVKGAFTGAVQSRIGRIHAAQGGTLFLDEIGDLPLGLQSKLLRFLEQGEVQRLGSTDTLRVDVRVVAATNSNLRRLVHERKFREDLFYRLSVFPIELPPLRDRMCDLIPLAETFLARFCAHNVVLSSHAITLLQQHTWPGNVREVRNVIERASIIVGAEQEITPEHIII
jgi:transcriptional regulator with GAF, ATPase, and Fis domain